jgi:hypothetical protein
MSSRFPRSQEFRKKLANMLQALCRSLSGVGWSAGGPPRVWPIAKL